MYSLGPFSFYTSNSDMEVLLHFVLFYFVMFGCYRLDARSFLMRDGKGTDLDGREVGEELRGVGGGETVIRIYCMRKEPIFNKNRK